MIWNETMASQSTLSVTIWLLLLWHSTYGKMQSSRDKDHELKMSPFSFIIFNLSYFPSVSKGKPTL